MSTAATPEGSSPKLTLLHGDPVAAAACQQENVLTWLRELGATSATPPG